MNRKHIIAAAATLLAGVISTGAKADVTGAPFTLDPSAIALSAQTAFTANSMTLVGNELITFAGAPFTTNNFTAHFVARAGEFQDSSSNPVSSGLGSTYQLFIQADIAGTALGCNSGTCSWNMTAADWSLIGVVGTPDILTAGTIGPPGTNPAISSNGNGSTTVIPLATGGVLSGTATFTAQGFGLNLFSSFATCASNGQALIETVNIVNPTNNISTCSGDETPFFVAPVPFFQIAFDSWTSVPQNASGPSGCTVDTTCTQFQIIAQPGVFKFVEVPEPASLTILGGCLAVFGLLGYRRRRGNAA